MCKNKDEICTKRGTLGEREHHVHQDHDYHENQGDNDNDHDDHHDDNYDDNHDDYDDHHNRKR